MKKVRVVLVLALVLTFFVGAQAFAGEVMDRIIKKGVLTVGTSADQVPFTVKNKAGKIIGLDADIARLMAGSMDVDLNLVAMPFSELLPALEAGKLDIVISGMTITTKRNMKVIFVGPYYVSGKGILTKRKTIAMMEDPNDMNKSNFKVVALKGSTSQIFVETAMGKSKFVPTQTLDNGLKLLIEDKADALIADYPYCVVTAFRHKDKGLVSGEAKLTYEPLGFALPPNDILFANWVNNFSGKLEGSGVLKKLQQRWFKPGIWIDELP